MRDIVVRMIVKKQFTTLAIASVLFFAMCTNSLYAQVEKINYAVKAFKVAWRLSEITAGAIAIPLFIQEGGLLPWIEKGASFEEGPEWWQRTLWVFGSSSLLINGLHGLAKELKPRQEELFGKRAIPIENSPDIVDQAVVAPIIPEESSSNDVIISADTPEGQPIVPEQK